MVKTKTKTKKKKKEDLYDYGETKFSDSFESTKDGDLKLLSKLARKQIELEQQIEDAEAVVQELKEQHKQLSEKEIPSLMLHDFQLQEITTAEGFCLKIKEVFGASIPQDKKEKAFAWLKKKGHDSIIKNNFQIEFGKGEEKNAEAFLKFLNLKKSKKQYPHWKRKEDIHGKTLTAFLKEWKQKEGKKIPVFFTIYEGYQTKITKKEE